MRADDDSVCCAVALPRLAIVALSDQDQFFHKDFRTRLNDYIDSAPPGTNEAAQKPRYHGAPKSSQYISASANGMISATAGGYGVEDLFKRTVPATHPDYVAHYQDMGNHATFLAGKTHHQYEYNPALTQTEGAQGTHDGRPHWMYQPDRRVAYRSAKYPWLVAAHRYHNKVNMHAEWDLVKVDFPAHVFNRTYMAEKGQDYIVRFTASSPSDATYYDAVDVRLHPDQVPADKIYSVVDKHQDGWIKTDHCQVTNPTAIVGPIRDATFSAVGCKNDAKGNAINVVPSTTRSLAAPLSL